MALILPNNFSIAKKLNGEPTSPKQKQVGYLEIDRSNSLSSNLIFAEAFGNSFLNPTIRNNNAEFGHDADGYYTYYPDTYESAGVFEHEQINCNTSNEPFSINIRFTPLDISTTIVRRVLYLSNAGAANDYESFISFFENNIRYQWRDALAGSVRFVTASTSLSNGDDINVTIVHKPEIEILVYIDGFFVTNYAVSGGVTGVAEDISFSHAGCPSSSVAESKIRHLYIWKNKALNDSEVYALYKNPYQLIKSINDSPFLFAATAAGGVTGTISTQESGSDSLSVSGDVLVNGQLSSTETGQDVSAIAGNVLIAGQFAVAETGSDSASLSGAVSISGQFSIAETGADQLSFNGNVIPAGNWYFSLVESGIDSISLQSNVLINGSANLIESGADVLSFSGSAPTEITGTLSAQESNFDSISLAASVFVSGSMALNESGADIIYLSQLQDVAKLRSRKRRGIKYYSSRPARVQ